MERVKLLINSVGIFIEGGDIKRVDIDGRTDILDHHDVKYFTEKKQGRIVEVSGKMTYKEIDFDFSVGYYIQEGMGKISVKKKGQKTGDLDIISEAYRFLYTLYKEFFIPSK